MKSILSTLPLLAFSKVKTTPSVDVTFTLPNESYTRTYPSDTQSINDPYKVSLEFSDAGCLLSGVVQVTESSQSFPLSCIYKEVVGSESPREFPTTIDGEVVGLCPGIGGVAIPYYMQLEGVTIVVEMDKVKSKSVMSGKGCGEVKQVCNGEGGYDACFADGMCYLPYYLFPPCCFLYSLTL